MDYEVNIIYYLNIFKKYYRKILFLVILAASVAFINGALKKTIYTSTCSILLLENSAARIPDFGRFFGIAGFSPSNSSANLMISIIKSKRMLDDIYSNFKELEKYRNFNLEIQVYDTLRGALIIEVKGEDPKLVSDIANFCVANLDVINAQLNITPERPMAKVLDKAVPATRPDPKHIPKRMGIAAIFAFFTGSVIFFGLEYRKSLIGREKNKE